MAEVGIDIDAMDTMVRDLEAVRDQMPAEVGIIRGRLDYVRLSTESISQVGFGGAIWGWLDGAIMDCHRRLALARLIAASSPGLSTVTFDDSMISDLSPAEVEALVEEVADLISAQDEWDFDPVDVDERLIEILGENAHDPYFAKLLAQRISPEDVDSYLSRVITYRSNEAGREGEDAVRAFDERYDELLNGLGMAFGIASTNTGETAVPGLADAWTDYLNEVVPTRARQGSAQRLSLVIARGTWSDDFIVDMYSTIRELEDELGPDAWATGVLDMVIDPDLTRSPGATVVEDPLAGVLLAMAANPDAVRRIFGSGPQTDVLFDDVDYGSVNAELYHLLRHRGSGEDTVMALMEALGAGLASAPVEGQTAWQPGLAEDLQAIVDSIDAEVAYAEANRPPWWSVVGHTILDLLGMVPVIGEAADGLNGLWYLAEGDHINAGISFGSMLPIAGWFVQGGKWVKRAFTADELATLGRLADSGDIARYLPGGRLVTNATDLADPSNFRPGSFLSPNELRRFSGSREWLQPLVAGRRFDDYMTPNYPHNQIRLDYGNGRYVILDSWVPGQAIVSRKLTQFADIQPQTARNYIDELVDKYPVGATIRNTPENISAGINGQTLTGRPILEVPPQAGPIPREILEYAHENGVRIIDVNGVDYTRHLFDPPPVPGGPV